MNQWFYNDQGQQRGPVSPAELTELRRRGVVHDNTLVWRQGMAEWQPLSLNPEAILGPPPPPSPFAPPRTQAHEDPIGSPVGGGPVVYGGFLRRWVALIVDSIVLVLPLAVIAAVITPMTVGAMGEDGGAAVIYLLWLLAAPIYYASLESSEWQATIGKRLIGIKVVDLEGRRIGFGRALGRWLASSLSYLTFYIGFLLAALTERKQALHDFVAGTLVVDRWAYTVSPEKQQQRMSGLVVGLIVFVVALVPISILAAIAIPAYHDYTVRARALEVLGTTGPAKTAIAEFVASDGSCPNDWSQLTGGAKPSSPLIGDSLVGEFDDGGCGMQITFASAAPTKLAGKDLYLTLDAESLSWSCTSNVEARYLPSSCR